MATELPHADRSPHDDERDPRFTGPQSLGPTRPSSRPSAFGPPRMPSSLPPPPGHAADPADARTADGPPQTSELRLKRTPLGHELDDDDDEGDRPTLPRVPPRMRPSIPTDIEQLLPISQAVKSLPRPPRMPVHEATLDTTPRRMPWGSIGVFACALLASTGSLVHYVEVPQDAHASTALPGVHTEPLRGATAQARADDAPRGAAPVHPAPAHASGALHVSGSVHIDARARAALRSHLGAAWSDTGRAREPLLAEAHHALAVGDHPLAAPLYRVLHPLHPAPAALGLAEIERARGDRPAAERWVQRALSARPRDPRPHRLYAELLEDRGHHDEARLERAVSRGLERSLHPTH
ncbi:MAG: hypothetical protein ABW252_05505 [Polyangiales bacterium]